MFEHKKIDQLDDFFNELDQRRDKGVYFYRINGFNAEIDVFLRRYYETARKTGAVIEGRIPNPDNRNLSYFEEIMGMNFSMDKRFLLLSLKKWLPRMNAYQLNTVVDALYDTFEDLKKAGKNDNMLKNAYIKFMCWLYYKFEAVVTRLGDNDLPKILYEGEISNYEFLLILVLCKAGCDVVLVQYKGDDAYLKLDPSSKESEKLELQSMVAFPEGYSMKYVREQAAADRDKQRLFGQPPKFKNCTNAWITGKDLDDFKVLPSQRGSAPDLFYNVYCRINGVWDKLTYTNDLFQFNIELKNTKRNVVIENESIPLPSPAEINSVTRRNYTQPTQLLTDLASQIKMPNIELQRIIMKAFLDVMNEEAVGSNLNKLTNKGIYLLCWIKRYTSKLFANWKMPDIPCFIYMGGCKNSNEALLMRLLARIPCDVLILAPNLNSKCCLEDKLLYEENNVSSMNLTKFPTESANLQMGTVAYQAERELDTLMYQDSGLYRNQQYSRANTVTLKTMYEEIALLWNEEMKYRPNFSTVDDVVNMPVLFAKVSGVKDGDLNVYWNSIHELVNDDTLLITDPPYVENNEYNEMKSYSTEFFKKGRVLKDVIKNHQSYKYGYLREEIQDYMLDKLQLLIDSRLIRGTFENGTEYTIVATVLNLSPELVRRIQSFDFTKKNPKLVYVIADESIISLEDSIITGFLNLIGFDIVFFVPTGYQSVEKYFTSQPMEEHQIGQYMYDLRVPDIRNFVYKKPALSWRERLFKRGK